MMTLAQHTTLTIGAQLPLLAKSGTDSSQIIILLVSAVVVIGLVVGGLVLASRAAHKRRTDSHPGLFTGLCQHHKLDRNRRNLLKAIGQAHQVKYPARVFLDPTLFDPKRLPAALSAKQEDILALRQQLFFVEEPSPSAG